VRERAGDGDALLLAPGQLPGQALVHSFEGDELEQFLAPRAPVRGLHPADAQCEFDVVGHRHVAEQGVVLEHEPDATITGAHVGDVFAMERDAAVIDSGQARDGT
jgi:hypothetical protein